MEQEKLQQSEAESTNQPLASEVHENETTIEVSVQEENSTFQPAEEAGEPAPDNLIVPEESANTPLEPPGEDPEQVREEPLLVNTTENDAPEESVQETHETLKNPPAIDFTKLKTEEIISTMKDLIQQYPVQQLRMLDPLPQIFDAQYQKEYEEAQIANGPTEQGDPFVYESDSKERFNTIYRLYREKRAEYYRRIEAEKEENLKIKLQIIEELKELIQKEESLNKTFQEFRNLQDRWRNTGMVPQNQLNDLLETYHLHVENFYSHIKINKELRDLDLKKNLDSKIALCEEAERLVEENDIANAFRQLQQLHARWKEIGPVPLEQKESIWERFKEATNKINEAHHRFFESLKAEQENNLKIKEDICARTEAMAAGSFNSPSAWNEATKQVLELQEEWRHSGTIPQKERNKIYKRFRNACDVFFDNKRKYYQQQQSEQESNLEKKIALCEKVEALKESTEWKTTTDKIISYQKEWKKIGPAPKKQSNKVWLRFRSACDHFFNKKSEHLKSTGSDQSYNLRLKRALIEEIRQFKLTGNNEEDIATLKEFQARWAEIGFVPIKEKNAIQTEFRNLLNELFDQLDIDEFDRNLERFKSKVNTFDVSEDSKDFKIVQEREKLVNKIKQLETDLHVWENNIGFFSKSKNSENLIKEFNEKIEAAREKLTLMYEKLKVIDSMI